MLGLRGQTVLLGLGPGSLHSGTRGVGAQGGVPGGLVWGSWGPDARLWRALRSSIYICPDNRFAPRFGTGGREFREVSGDLGKFSGNLRKFPGI